jgi:Nucleoside-diphosphate-sugar epimerases
MTMNIYITGGTGFIGSYIVKEFADGKNNVVVLARNPAKVPALCSLPGVTVKKADMLDYSELENSLTDIDALIHVALCWGDTGPEMIQNETLSSVKIIDTAIRKGAQKIIYTSSTAAQGGIKRDTDEAAKMQPNDFYGATKGSVELFLSAYSNYYPAIQINTVRPGYTFGNPVIPGAFVEGDQRFKTICANAKNDQPIEVTKCDGTQFIHAADLAKVYRNVIESDLKNEVFYGLSSKFTTWEQIARWAVEFTGSKSEIKVIDKGWSPDPPFYMVEKIKNYFGLVFNSTERLKEHMQYLISVS